MDLIGTRFGRLVVVGVEKRKNKESSGKIKTRNYWECLCNCGKKTYVPSCRLRNGKTQSCGCLKRQRLQEFMGKNFIDIRGQVFGKLTVISRANNRTHRTMWNCRCSCGITIVTNATDLRSGHTKQCRRCSKLVHGESRSKNQSSTAEYRIWDVMKQRCSNPNCHGYENYGGRGIEVCDRWLESYLNFIADMGARPTPFHSIDRIDVNGNYEPSNCRWATRREQALNTRANHRLSLNGKIQSITEWSRETGVKSVTIHSRLRYGWSVERALTEPVRSRKKFC